MNTYNSRCLDNHQCFRVLLQAMSRPGKIFTLPGDQPAREQVILRLLDTVLDQQVCYGVFEDMPELEAQLRNLSRSRAVSVESADFLLAPSGSSGGKLRSAKRGRPEFPDEGATIIFAVDALKEGSAGKGFRLTGPGIKDEAHISIEGVDLADMAALKEINAGYPLGVESVFVDKEGRLLSLPRSTRIGGEG